MFPTFLVRRSARVSATPPTKTAWQASAIGGLADAGGDRVDRDRGDDEPAAAVKPR